MSAGSDIYRQTAWTRDEDDLLVAKAGDRSQRAKVTWPKVAESMNAESRQDGIPRRTYTAELVSWRYHKITKQAIPANLSGPVFPGIRASVQTLEPKASNSTHVGPRSELHDIEDLDPKVKGPLMKSNGLYHCRFRELVGCQLTYTHVQSVNRHSLIHCKDAIPCTVSSCRKKFLERSNWEIHFRACSSSMTATASSESPNTSIAQATEFSGASPGLAAEPAQKASGQPDRTSISYLLN